LYLNDDGQEQFRRIDADDAMNWITAHRERVTIVRNSPVR
jgi:hypothetical protein